MKKMLTTILTRLFCNELGGRKTDEMNVADEVEVNFEKQPERKTYDDPDLNILAEKYGELVPGKEIMIELGEAAKMLGRTRVRLDAFSSLTKKLHNEYSVELKIYSRRTKLETKGAEDEDLHGRNSD